MASLLCALVSLPTECRACKGSSGEHLRAVSENAPLLFKEDRESVLQGRILETDGGDVGAFNATELYAEKEDGKFYVYFTTIKNKIKI